jgi:uncharacterized repeat protein (TIGR02543 family)
VTIAFVENRGSKVSDIVAFAGTLITESTAPTKEGHRFAGWFTDEEFSFKYEFTLMPATNLSLCKMDSKSLFARVFDCR